MSQKLDVQNISIEQVNPMDEITVEFNLDTGNLQVQFHDVSEKTAPPFKVKLYYGDIEVPSDTDGTDNLYNYILNLYKPVSTNQPVPVGSNQLTLKRESNTSSKAASRKSSAETLVEEMATISFEVIEDRSTPIPVRLTRAVNNNTPDEKFWKVLKNKPFSFQNYKAFLDGLLAFDNPEGQTYQGRSVFIRADAYNIIKFATEAYMLKSMELHNHSLTGYLTNGNLPYYEKVLSAIENYFPATHAPVTTSAASRSTSHGMYDKYRNIFTIELIWSYWMEQGLLAETMKLISMRFRNHRGSKQVDLLQRFDTDPLRPLSHILWGYTQDAQHRLLAEQRSHEYMHAYGLATLGNNLQLQSIDTRSTFLESFHNLLNACSLYFKESDDTTRIADAFPILNCLKEVHLLLAEGNHNAYGGLTWTARHEMLVQQYILSRSEMREFLGGRAMVPYNEPWMDRVDTVRNIIGWGGISITHYHELAVYGEQILLSIRLGDWTDVNYSSANAGNWANIFRDAIQSYIHALRTVTGIDLNVDQLQAIPTIAMQPPLLIQKRIKNLAGFQKLKGIKPYPRF